MMRSEFKLTLFAHCKLQIAYLPLAMFHFLFFACLMWAMASERIKIASGINASR